MNDCGIEFWSVEVGVPEVVNDDVGRFCELLASTTCHPQHG